MPDPGNYRKSMWTEVGLPDGPKTWDDLRRGGAEIKSKRKVPVGIGMSQEIDSNMAGRSLLWSYGGAIQDEREQVILNSPETVAAVTYMKGLFEDAMTNEVFAWNPASNNQALVAGKLNYIVNSISAYRTMQQVNPKVAEDVFFVPALEGSEGGDRGAARHVQLARPQARQEPRRGAGVPPALHGELRARDVGERAVRLPRVRQARRRSSPAGSTTTRSAPSRPTSSPC